MEMLIISVLNIQKCTYMHNFQTACNYEKHETRSNFVNKSLHKRLILMQWF